MIYSVAQNSAAALAERGRVELLFTAAERESRVWLQIWGTSCPELLGMRRQGEDGEGEEERSCRLSKTALRREKVWRICHSLSCTLYFGKQWTQAERTRYAYWFQDWLAVLAWKYSLTNLAEDQSSRHKPEAILNILIPLFGAKQTAWPKLVIQLSIRHENWDFRREASECDACVSEVTLLSITAWLHTPHSTEKVRLTQSFVTLC